MVVYEGFFFEGTDLPHSLYRDITDKHVTMIYKPSKPNYDLYGTKAVFSVIGYGNDGVNEGYRVQLVSIKAENEAIEAKIKELYDKIEVPHITLSVSKEGKPVNTRYLDFQPHESIQLVGVYRGHD